MIRRLTLSLLLVGCGASSPAPGVVSADVAPIVIPAPDPAAESEPRPPKPFPSVEALRAEMFCGGQCPAYALAPQPSDVALTLRRAFPSYQITVRTDGEVIYEGFDAVKVRGRVVERVDPRAVKELVRRFEGAGYSFGATGMNIPPACQLGLERYATSLTLARGRRSLTILHCGSAPFRLADELDEVVSTARWTRCDPEAPAACAARDRVAGFGAK